MSPFWCQKLPKVNISRALGKGSEHHLSLYQPYAVCDNLLVHGRKKTNHKEKTRTQPPAASDRLRLGVIRVRGGTQRTKKKRKKKKEKRPLSASNRSFHGGGKSAGGA